MLKRIEHIAILLLVVVLPFGNILRFDFNNGISVLGIDIIASILLLSSIMKVFTIKYVVRKIVSRSGLVVPFLTIALLSAVVHVFSYPIQTMLIGIMYFVRLVLYFNIGFILLQKSKAELNKVLAHTLLSLTVFAGLGLTQYILFPDLRSLYYQGWDEHLYRVFGTLFDPNFSGVVYILGFFVACGFYLESKQKNGSFNNSSIYYAISSGICFTGLMLTYSRSSYIMFGMAVILLSFFFKKSKIFVRNRHIFCWWTYVIAKITPE